MEYRKHLELKHNRNISRGNEIKAWGWSGAAGKHRLRRRSELINNFIGSYAKEIGGDEIKILELGCGTGSLTETLACPERGAIVSTDLDERFVRNASNRRRYQRDSFSFIVADAEYLPFLDGSLNLIVGISVLHHLYLDVALKEIHRVLKKGGRFGFSEPNMMNPQIFIQKNVKFIKKYFGDSPFETAFYASKIKEMFAKYGLNIQVRHFDFLHPSTPKILIPFVKRLGLRLEKNPYLKHVSGSLFICGEKTGE